jgi:hypothetical protein
MKQLNIMVIGETRFDWIERGRNMIFILSKCEMDKQHKNKNLDNKNWEFTCYQLSANLDYCI